MSDRAPFRLERSGERIELVHYIGDEAYRYGLSLHNLLWLAQDANAAVAGIALDEVERRFSDDRAVPRKGEHIKNSVCQELCRDEPLSSAVCSLCSRQFQEPQTF